MKDFQEYDTAKSAYLKNLGLNRMPLFSWDLHAVFFQKTNIDLSDLKALQALKITHDWVSGFDFEKELKEENVIVVTDPNLKIVFASHNLFMMTGYKCEEVIGKTPKFFQGKTTSKKINNEIRRAIQKQKPFEKTVVNYRKTGGAYNCHIKGFPVFNKKGELSHFIAFEKAA